MREHRGHLGGALLTIAGGALIAAGLGSTVLVVIGALCIVGALWAFGAWGALWRRLLRTKGSPLAAAVSPTWAPPPLPPEGPGAPLARVIGQAVEQQKEYGRRIEHGEKLLKVITEAKLSCMSMPKPFAEDVVAELTAQVDAWRGEVQGYVLPKLDKGWRTALAELKLYVEKELAAMPTRQGEQ